MGRLPVHMQFCQFEDTKPYVEGFIDPEFGHLALHSTQILTINTGVHELRFSHQATELLLVDDIVDWGSLLLLLAGFTIHTVIH